METLPIIFFSYTSRLCDAQMHSKIYKHKLAFSFWRLCVGSMSFYCFQKIEAREVRWSQNRLQHTSLEPYLRMPKKRPIRHLDAGCLGLLEIHCLNKGRQSWMLLKWTNSALLKNMRTGHTNCPDLCKSQWLFFSHFVSPAKRKLQQILREKLFLTDRYVHPNEINRWMGTLATSVLERTGVAMFVLNFVRKDWAPMHTTHWGLKIASRKHSAKFSKNQNPAQISIFLIMQASARFISKLQACAHFNSNLLF